MLKRINLWYCLPPFFILCIFVATLSLVHSQNRSRQNPTFEDQLAELKTNQEIVEMVKMGPIAGRVLALSTETLHESFLKLATYDDDQYGSPGYTTNVYGEMTEIQELLSNRRVIKILQEFEKLPLDQAKIKAKELHKIALDSLSQVIDEALVAYTKFPTAESYGVIRPNELFMAMTSVLLSASLGDIPFVLHRIEEWERMVAIAKNKILSNEKSYPLNFAEGYSQCVFLDPTSFVTMLMFATERKGSIPEIVKNKVAEYETFDIPIVAWNAERTYYDDLKYHGGGSTISLENMLMDFRVYNLRKGAEEWNRSNQELIQFLKKAMASTN